MIQDKSLWQTFRYVFQHQIDNADKSQHTFKPAGLGSMKLFPKEMPEIMVGSTSTEVNINYDNWKKHLKCKGVAAGRIFLMFSKHCHICWLLASPSIAEPECEQENGVQGNPAV